LDVSKVTVVFNIKCLFHVKPKESFIPLHFMLLVQFHWALRDDMAIVVDGSDVVM
jgi:hypothetical protein